MSTAQHTPGPWQIETPVGRGSWIGKDGEWAALACGVTDEIAAANARVIAAAPFMLDALRYVGNALATAQLENRRLTKDEQFVLLSWAVRGVTEATGAQS